MVALGIPIPAQWGQGLQARGVHPAAIRQPFPDDHALLRQRRRGAQTEVRQLFRRSDLFAGDFLFMRKYMPLDLSGKTIMTNTTTKDNMRAAQIVRREGGDHDHAALRRPLVRHEHARSRLDRLCREGETVDR